LVQELGLPLTLGKLQEELYRTWFEIHEAPNFIDESLLVQCCGFEHTFVGEAVYADTYRHLLTSSEIWGHKLTPCKGGGALAICDVCSRSVGHASGTPNCAYYRNADDGFDVCESCFRQRAKEEVAERSGNEFLMGYHSWIKFHLDERVGRTTFLGHKYSMKAKEKSMRENPHAAKVAFSYHDDTLDRYFGWMLQEDFGDDEPPDADSSDSERSEEETLVRNFTAGGSVSWVYKGSCDDLPDEELRDEMVRVLTMRGEPNPSVVPEEPIAQRALTKSQSSFFVGSSPEVELALGTLMYYLSYHPEWFQAAGLTQEEFWADSETCRMAMSCQHGKLCGGQESPPRQEYDLFFCRMGSFAGSFFPDNLKPKASIQKQQNQKEKKQGEGLTRTKTQADRRKQAAQLCLTALSSLEPIETAFEAHGNSGRQEIATAVEAKIVGEDDSWKAAESRMATLRGEIKTAVGRRFGQWKAAQPRDR
jgi:hypothetical protein